MGEIQHCKLHLELSWNKYIKCFFLNIAARVKNKLHLPTAVRQPGFEVHFLLADYICSFNQQPICPFLFFKVSVCPLIECFYRSKTHHALLQHIPCVYRIDVPAGAQLSGDMNVHLSAAGSGLITRLCSTERRG